MATAKTKAKSKSPAKAKTTKAVPKKARPTKKGATAAAEATTGDVRRRWKDMSVAELQALYAEKVGRPTGSNDRNYLTWKIREAEKGNVPVGPAKRKLYEGPTTPITIKLEDAFLEQLDDAGKDDGFKTRLAYLRDLIGKGLQVRGRSDLATMVAG